MTKSTLAIKHHWNNIFCGATARILGQNVVNESAGLLFVQPYNSKMVKSVLGPLLGVQEMAKNFDVEGQIRDGRKILVKAKPIDMWPSGWVFDLPDMNRLNPAVVLGWVTGTVGHPTRCRPLSFSNPCAPSELYYILVIFTQASTSVYVSFRQTDFSRPGLLSLG